MEQARGRAAAAVRGTRRVAVLALVVAGLAGCGDASLRSVGLSPFPEESGPPGSDEEAMRRAGVVAGPLESRQGVQDPYRIAGGEEVGTRFICATYDRGITVITREVYRTPLDAAGRPIQAQTRVTRDRTIYDDSAKRILAREGDPRIARQLAFRAQTELEEMERADAARASYFDPRGVVAAREASYGGYRGLRSSIAAARAVAAAAEGPGASIPPPSPVTPQDMPVPMPRPPHMDMPPT